MGDGNSESIKFTHVPPEHTESSTLPLIRVPPKRTVGGLILSHRLIGASLHYWKGRTRPCTAPNCEACEGNYIPRWYGYLAILDEKKNKIGMIEVPARASWAIHRSWCEQRTLRGWRIELSRVGTRANAPVCVSLSEHKLEGRIIPECPDLVRALCRMWEVKELQTHLEVYEPGTDRVQAILPIEDSLLPQAKVI